MKKNYQNKTAPAATAELVMPDTVAVAMDDLAETVREGLLALAVGAGLQVMQVMMAESVTAVCGPKGQHDAERKAVRHGSEDGSVTLGGRRVPVRRPRVRTADGTTEVAVPAYDRVRLDRAAGRDGPAADDGQAVDPPVLGGTGARRYQGRVHGPVHVEVGGEPAVRRRH